MWHTFRAKANGMLSHGLQAEFGVIQGKPRFRSSLGTSHSLTYACSGSWTQEANRGWAVGSTLQSLTSCSVGVDHLEDLPSSTVQEHSPSKQERVKLRTPAWTDRVLWKSGISAQQQLLRNPSEAPVRQLIYNSVKNMAFSDHRAVHALFCIQVSS